MWREIKNRERVFTILPVYTCDGYFRWFSWVWRRTLQDFYGRTIHDFISTQRREPSG